MFTGEMGLISSRTTTKRIWQTHCYECGVNTNIKRYKDANLALHQERFQQDKVFGAGGERYDSNSTSFSYISYRVGGVVWSGRHFTSERVCHY